MTPAIFGIAGPRLSAEERAVFRDCDPVGYILFARNCIDRDQMRALTDELKAIHGRERTFISIDQEGGRVARMKPPEWNRYPAGQAFDELYQIAPASAIEAVRLNAEAIARELSEVGVTVDFHAPFDVRRPETSDVIGDRALGTDPLQVAALGRATLEGMARGGVLGCLKHMPGHGRATADSHHAMPRVEASLEALMESDFRPFRALRDMPIGLSAHVCYEAFDADLPGTLSPTIIADAVRGAIGFDGLLLSDDLSMEALSGSLGERARAALAAGCDLALHCNGEPGEMADVAENVTQLSPEGLRRWAISKENLNEDNVFNYNELHDEFNNLMEVSAKP